MTISHNRQNLSALAAVNEIEIFDDKGRIDIVVSNEANKEIFSEANVIRHSGGAMNHVASVVNHAATNAAIRARRK